MQIHIPSGIPGALHIKKSFFEFQKRLFAVFQSTKAAPLFRCRFVLSIDRQHELWG
jgi:hypothetical protein